MTVYKTTPRACLACHLLSTSTRKLEALEEQKNEKAGKQNKMPVSMPRHFAQRFLFVNYNCNIGSGTLWLPNNLSINDYDIFTIEIHLIANLQTCGFKPRTYTRCEIIIC